MYLISNNMKNICSKWNKEIPDRSIIYYDTLNKIRDKKLYFRNYFDYSEYATYWYNNLLNKDFKILPFSLIEDYCKKNNINEIFIRSNSSKKLIPGHTVKVNDLWIDEKTYLPEKHLLCIISEIKEIKKEYRLVITNNNKILGASEYKHDYIGYDLDNTIHKWMIDFVSEIVYHPSEVYIIDICLDKNNNPKIIEANGIHSSCLYAMNYTEVFKGISLVMDEIEEEIFSI